MVPQLMVYLTIFLTFGVLRENGLWMGEEDE